MIRGTISNQFARRLVAAAAAMGAHPPSLLAAVGLSPDAFVDPEGRLPFETAHRLLDEIERVTATDFGLRAAELTLRHTETVLGTAVKCSRTVGDAYRRAARYSALINDTVQLHVHLEGDEARIVQEQHHPLGAHRLAAEFSLAVLCLVAREAVGAAFRPRRVWFRHPAPADRSHHDHMFGVAPTFSAARYELAVPRALLDAPMPGASDRLCAHIDPLLDELLRSLPQRDQLVGQVRAILSEAMNGGSVTVEQAAARLGMTPRSLQRRLRAESGVSFNQVRDQLRNELAQRYLKRNDLSLAEVSFLLGFSEPSTFHRAFRRWTGVTPDGWRRQRTA